MSDLKFSVVGHSESATRVAVKARDFTLVVDEPIGLGGQDLGPNPVEYELAALVGCINVMGHIIAKEMSFGINSLKIKASGQLNPDRLFGKETADRAGYKNIEVVLEVDADTDQDTLDIWMKKIESRCPVSDNLTNTTPVTLALKALAVA
ncbi:OsmC family protein [Photobacterium sp. J15]|uniref:OsmC family protein n=1 Tax=Photobacterium sp. J15 TaxID=265901 RepID=UPI0007E40C3D|nr:OsmC family protein [Photobacterium sp. J15]